MTAYHNTELEDLTDAARQAGHVFGVLLLGAVLALVVLWVVWGGRVRG